MLRHFSYRTQSDALVKTPILCLAFAGSLLVGCLSAGAQSVTALPGSLSFGNQVQGTISSALHVTLKNGQSSGIAITSIATSLADYIATSNCPVGPALLGAGASCTISISFKPAATGSRTGTVTVIDSGASSPQRVSLAGTGSATSLVSIAVTPATASIAAGKTQQFIATGRYSDGSTQNLTSTAPWSSSATSVATVKSTTGLAKGVAVGNATVSVASGTISGSASLTVTPAVLIKFTVTPASASVAAGTTHQLIATGLYSDGSMQNLTNTALWSSQAPTVATVKSSTGLAKGLTVGSATIVAIYGSMSGSTLLAVTPAILTRISVNPASPSVAAGMTRQFTATGIYSDGSTQNLTSTAQWSSSATAVATVSSTGLATAHSQGTATIAAQSGTLSGSATLTVTNAVLRSISVAPTTSSIAAGQTQQFTATGNYSDGSAQNLTGTVVWTSSVPVVATVTAGGLASAVAQGSAAITATLGAIKGSATLAVTPPALTSLSVSPVLPSIALGGNLQFTATGTYTDGSTQNVTATAQWSSDTPTVATINNAPPSYGLASGVGQGTATITASVGPVTASTTLTIIPALVSLAINPVTLSLPLGTTQQLTATGTYSDGSTLDLTNSVTWNTADGTIATVNAKGLVSAVAVGATTTSASSEAIVGSTTVTIIPATLVSIALTPAIPSIPLGATQQFTATGTYTNGSTQNITATVQWSSDTPSVATIDNGPPTSGLASGVGQGTATITASVGAVTASTTLTVTPALVSLAITPPAPSLALGTTQQFTATGTYSDGSTLDLTSTAAWSSDTPSSAKISNTGFATSVGIGIATVTASVGGVSGSTVLTVTAAALVSIAISPAAPAIPLGLTQQFTAIGTFTDGTSQDVTQSGHWSSTVATVATISNSSDTAGLATSLATGATTIGISFGGQSASVPLTVNPAAITLIAISPLAPAIALGTTQQLTAIGTYSDGTTQDVTSVVTWSSSDATVAIISNSVGSYGLATSSGVGTATITATSLSVSSSTTITVGQAAISSISVIPSSVSITLGSSEQFSALATYTNGSTQDVTQSATWASSVPSVATVNSTGLASGILVGTTSISASSGALAGAAVLTVNAPVPVSLLITPANATVSASAQLQLAATLYYNDGSSIDVTSSVTWSSSNALVASIGNTGLVQSLTAGSSTVGASWAANSFATTAALTVYAAGTFFVAPNGNDSWSGGLADPNSTNSDGPFASLSRAQLAVQNAPKPATVLLRNGTYYPALTPLTANSYPGTLKFTSAHSGTSSTAQVTWQNYPGETPVINGGVAANADPTTGAGLHLQWTNSGNWYQAPLPATLSNNVALQPFEYLFYNGQRRMRSRVHDNGTSPYPSIGYFMQNGQCIASPSTPAGQHAPTLASCNLGTFLRIANAIAPSSALGQGCPSASGVVNGVMMSKCLDRFIYTNTSGGDPIQPWKNLSSSYTGNPASPCAPIPGNSYPPGDVELTLVDAWTVDIMRINCVDTADNVIFFLGAAKGGMTAVNPNIVYNFFGPAVGHRYIIENTLDAFTDALTPTSSQYGVTGIWYLDRHASPWVLNYIANNGENPSTDNIVIPQLGGAIPGSPATDYVGASLLSATNLSYVTFQGITFEMDDFYPDSIGFDNDINGEMSLPQTIDCENCQFVTFNAVTVRHTSASALLAATTAPTPACSGSNPPSCVVVQNSAFYDIGDSGIRIGHTPTAADSPATVVQDVMIQNNLIDGYSRVFLDGEGIAEGNGNNNQFLSNTIMDGYHAGISVCYNGCGPTNNGTSVSGNNIISSYNLISSIMQGITSDGGALYYNIGNGGSSGIGNAITSNVVNNITDSYIIDNAVTAGVTVIGSGYGGAGIYLDAQSAGVNVSNNVVYNLSGYAINLTQGLASSKQTQNTFTNNILAFGNSGMFHQGNPWPTGCPASPIKQVDVTNNIFYFDRRASSTPSFHVIQGCSDSCGQAYNSYQNFQGNSYWRTDGLFAAESKAFQVLTTQRLNSNNTCKVGPLTSLYFSSQSAPSWQNGGSGVPVSMSEDLPPTATASYQPPFSGSGLASDPPAAYFFNPGQPTPPTPFAPANTNFTILNAHSSLPPPASVPATFPTYVYGSPLNKF